MLEDDKRLTKMYLCVFLESSVPAEVIGAVDVNTTANEIYKHNFPNTPLLPKTIEVSLYLKPNFYCFEKTFNRTRL